MDSELSVKSFLSIFVRGILCIIILSFITISPASFNQVELKPIFKGPRSCLDLPDYPVKPIKGHKPKKAEQLYKPIISDAADRYSVDPAMINAIIMAESSYNPYAVSEKGAVGLMQLMPATASEMGVEDRLDPVHNIYGGVRYYKKLLNIFEGDIFLALSAYHAGIEKVKKYKGIPPFRATRYYVVKALQYYRYYKDQLEKESSVV